MTFDAIDTWWWPYLFILLAGWLATDMWRFLGVYLGGRVSEKSEALVLVRALATALVAAVIGNLIVFPSGALADVPLGVRIFSAVVGFAAFLSIRKSTLAGIVAAEAVLLTAIYVFGQMG